MSKNSYIISGPGEDECLLPKGLTLAEYMFECLRKRSPSDILYVDADTNETQTCGELLDDAIKAVQVFKKWGLQKGDVITIITENMTKCSIPLIAALSIGVAFNPLNPKYTTDELRHALLLSKPKVLLCSGLVYNKVKHFTKEFRFLETISFIGKNAETDNHPSVEYFDNLLVTIPVDHHGYQPEHFDGEHVAFIMLSSGTSGLPKGVLITHNNVFNALELCSHPNFITKAGDWLLVPVPCFHIYGLFMHFLPIAMSNKNILLQHFEPHKFLRTIQDYKVNGLCLVPGLIAFLGTTPLIESYDVSSIEDIMCAGATLGNQLEALKKRFELITFRQVYGTTELSACTTISVGLDKKSNCVGRLIFRMQGKVVDGLGNPVGCNETGELCFRGASLMKGYLGISNNNSIIDEEGFYHSGDAGYYDEEGFFYIIDRIREIIKYKGYQVSPTELEQILLTHPAINDSGVVGKPDERAGHVAVAFVVLNREKEATEKEIIDYVAERISINKHLHGGVRFIEKIPRNAAGKILRSKLVELL